MKYPLPSFCAACQIGYFYGSCIFSDGAQEHSLTINMHPYTFRRLISLKDYHILKCNNTHHATGALTFKHKINNSTTHITKPHTHNQTSCINIFKNAKCNQHITHKSVDEPLKLVLSVLLEKQICNKVDM